MEKIILAPGVSGNELSKSLAMHGKNSFNLRICGDKELARIGLMRSGISVTETFLDFHEENNVVAEAVDAVNEDMSDSGQDIYFSNPSNSDIQQIANALRRMRSFVVAEDSSQEKSQIIECLSKGEFMDKNNALISVYKKFMDIIESRKLMDSISLIRLAISRCNAITGTEFYVLEEFPLSPIQEKLLEVLSGGTYKETNLFELFGTEKIGEDNPLKINSIKNCYGAANEVETILDDIYRSKSLDKCTVAVTDPKTYSQLFFDYAVLYNIPITFGCGIPITNSNPAKLLTMYSHWMTDSFYSGAVLNDLFSNNTFNSAVLKKTFSNNISDYDEDKYYEIFRGVKRVLEHLRLTNDMAVNRKRLSDYKQVLSDKIQEKDEYIKDEYIKDKYIKDKYEKELKCIPYLEVLSEELALPVEDFIKKYAYIRKSSKTNSENLLMLLDMAAVNTIYDEMKIFRGSSVEQSEADMIRNVLSSSVLKSRSEQGSLYVTSVETAISFIRDNLFVAGLSASKYPGTPTETYLLLDTDLALFGEGTEQFSSDYSSDFSSVFSSVFSSNGRIRNKREKLFNLVELASSLGSEINISYAGLNVSELKKDNRSSLIYELYRKEKGEGASSDMLDADTINIGYFEPAISVNRKVGEAYNAGKVIIQQEMKERAEVTNACSLEKEYSPTVLDDFFKCPRKYFLKYELNINEPDERNEFEIISATESGVLAHALMEELANSDMDEAEFMDLAGVYFDRFIREYTPVVPQDVRNEKEQFMDMMRISYKMDTHRPVILKEEDLHFVHESGVKLHGFPDRVERLEDGSVLIVDYKTGRTVSHEQDSIKTCLQVIIYAYLMERAGEKVAGCEYRYIRLGETVSCKYDESIKDSLNKWLSIFKDKLEKNDFPIPSTADNEDDSLNPCKYCKFGAICGKGDK